jgi:hypothetical protein
MKLLQRKDRSLMMLVALGVLFANSRPACADAFNFVPFAFPGADITFAQGINNSGDIVGFATEPFESGFLYQSGNFNLFPGIVGISNNGMILGVSASGPFILSGGIVTPLNAQGESVLAINNSGTVLVSNGFLIGSTIHTINFPGSTSTTVRGINDLGEIVGSYQDSKGTHGFLYSAGVYTTIDFPGAITSTAYAINNEGQIVGNYFFDQGKTLGIPGFIYENGNFQTFAGFNFITEETETVPTGINDFEEITGYQFESLGGGTRSFVATPVPEPESLGLVATGLMMIAGVVRRRLC